MRALRTGKGTTARRPATANGTRREGPAARPHARSGASRNDGAGTARNARPQAARLGNTADDVAGNRDTSSAEAIDDAELRAYRREQKRHRYRLRTGLWKMSNLERVKACGRYSQGGEVGVRRTTLPDGSSVAGYSGLQHCGSPSACPVCMSAIAAQRVDEMSGLFNAAIRAGDTIALFTPTVRHHAGHSLEESMSAIGNAWRWIQQQRAWKGETDSEYECRLATWRKRAAHQLARRPREREETYRKRQDKRAAKVLAARPVRHVGIRERYGVKGFVRAFEAPKGQHGWHPHFHIAFVFEGQHIHSGGEPCAIEGGFADELWALYEKAIVKQGFEVMRGVFNPDTGRIDEAGFSVDCSGEADGRKAAEYLVKSMALELTHGHTKKSRSGQSRTHLELLADAIVVDDQGNVAVIDEEALAAWHEWEHTMHGKKLHTYSRDLRSLYNLEAEKDDQVVVDEDRGEEDLLVITKRGWAKIRHQQIELLYVVEDGGVEAAARWLERRHLPGGLYWRRGPDAPRRTGVDEPAT